MNIHLRGPLRSLAALVLCLGFALGYASAHDDEGRVYATAITPVSETGTATGTARSQEQINTAAARLAQEVAEAAAQAERDRLAALSYQPVYGGAVQYSTAKSAGEVITANGRALGNFKLTFYCPCAKCNGKWSGGITSSGKTAAEGRTIAVDPRVIPIGSRVFIEGYGDFIAEDVGGAIKGNKIDVFLTSHSRCYQLGVQYANVYVMS